MALLPEVFTPENEESNEFKPIEAGWYAAEIVKSELKTTAKKDGKYLALCFRIIDGEHEGRLVFSNLNIVNPNKTAVKIARGDLKAICDAVGFIGELEDTVDIHNKPLKIKVTVKPETPQWPAKNEIKGYKADEDDEAPF